MTIQRDWTDADGMVSGDGAAQETTLTTTLLLDLVALVDALRARS
jgi:hypothetical protein